MYRNINRFRSSQNLNNLNMVSSRWKLINNVVVALLAVWGLSSTDFKKNKVSFFEGLLIELVAPIQRGSLSIQEKISYTIDHYFTIVNTSKENSQLKKKVLSLEQTIFKLGEVQSENTRIKQLLEFSKDLDSKKVLAQVVSWDAASEFKVLRINKGSANGLKLMAPVITMTGLVGYVYRVGRNYSDILTILDQNNRVDVIVTRTRTHGIVEGRSDFICRMKYVSRTEKLEIGDEVITAGLGEIYPKGVRVGTVTQIDKKNYGITQKIELTPSVDFHKLEEVIVLVSQGKRDLKEVVK